LFRQRRSMVLMLPAKGTVRPTWPHTSPSPITKEGGYLLRRAILLVAFITLNLVLAGRVALAATVNCVAGADCAGTPNPDTINGSAEGDNMFSRAGADTVKGNEGGDYLQGDRGADDLGGGDGRR
jgi:hypothetical protein